MELLNKTSLDILGQGKDTELVQQQKQEYKTHHTEVESLE